MLLLELVAAALLLAYLHDCSQLCISILAGYCEGTKLAGEERNVSLL